MSDENLTQIDEERLISENMGLVITLARSFKPKNTVELDDYIQSGRIGLWKAIRKHDPKKGALSTIAWYYIRWEIIRNMPSARKRSGEKQMVNFTDLCSSLPNLVEGKQCGLSLAEIEPDSLTLKERKVLRLRAAGHTMKDIGIEFGHSRGWANETFKSAIKKIRDANK